MEIEYNTPIQVSKAVQLKVVSQMSSLCAHRTDDKGNHWVSLWVCRPEWKFMLNRIING